MLLASLAFLCGCGLLLWRARTEQRPYAGWVAFLMPTAILIFIWSKLPAWEDLPYLETWPWVESIGLQLSFHLDGLALLFTLIILLIGAVVALYTYYYLHDDLRQSTFYLFLFLFMASMLGIVWSDNVLLLFVFWEGTTFTSYFLIGHRIGQERSQKAARQALYITGAGGLSLLWGLLLLASTQNTYELSLLLQGPIDLTDPNITLALALILVGAFTKSGQFPFHFWLPGAMAAPTPASAYLHSATMVKAGIYLIARLHPLLSDHPVWMPALLSFGAITAIVCAIFSMTKTDLKAILAYATLTQLGLLFIGLGTKNELAALAVVLGILAHAFYKGPLFLVVGLVEHASSTRDYRSLAGLAKPLKVVFLTSLLASVSLMGVPVWPGFVAKEYLLSAFLPLASLPASGLDLLAVVAVVVAGATFATTAVIMTFGLFLKSKPDDASFPLHPHHPSFGMQAGPLLLTILGFASPLFLTGSFNNLTEAAALSIVGHSVSTPVHLWSGFGMPLLLSLLAIGLGIAAFLFLPRFLRFEDLYLSRVPSGEVLFERLQELMIVVATKTTATLQSRSLSTHIAIVMSSAIVFVLLSWRHFGLEANMLRIVSESRVLVQLEIILAGIGVAAAATAVLARVRLTSIISVSVVGLVVTLWFVLFAAPDLALTQLLVEVLLFVLILIIFFKLPETSPPETSLMSQLRSILLAFGMGAFGFLLVLLTAGEPVFQPVGEQLLKAATAGPHGGANVVNVILVDFRGFDTFGEMTVIAIAGIGVFSLVRAHRLRIRASNTALGKKK